MFNTSVCNTCHINKKITYLLTYLLSITVFFLTNSVHTMSACSIHLSMFRSKSPIIIYCSMAISNKMYKLCK